MMSRVGAARKWATVQLVPSSLVEDEPAFRSWLDALGQQIRERVHVEGYRPTEGQTVAIHETTEAEAELHASMAAADDGDFEEYRRAFLNLTRVTVEMPVERA